MGMREAFLSRLAITTHACRVALNRTQRKYRDRVDLWMWRCRKRRCFDLPDSDIFDVQDLLIQGRATSKVIIKRKDNMVNMKNPLTAFDCL